MHGRTETSSPVHVTGECGSHERRWFCLHTYWGKETLVWRLLNCLPEYQRPVVLCPTMQRPLKQRGKIVPDDKVKVPPPLLGVSRDPRNRLLFPTYVFISYDKDQDWRPARSIYGSKYLFVDAHGMPVTMPGAAMRWVQEAGGVLQIKQKADTSPAADLTASIAYALNQRVEITDPQHMMVSYVGFIKWTKQQRVGVLLRCLNGHDIEVELLAQQIAPVGDST